MIRGTDQSDRDTSDAPLWFFVACSDFIKASGNKKLLSEDCKGRTVEKVLESIIENYINGTPNGIKMDEESGLIFSPSHFTWMDTNHPAGTPREGYPIEIQSLWFFALDFYFKISGKGKYKKLSEQVSNSISELFTKSPNGCLSDCLYADSKTPAQFADPDDAIRSNQLFAITLGAVKNKSLCEKIITASEQLLIPGAIRSLANLPVTYPLPVLRNGELLNDPMKPYFGKYTGDEDTRRKAAYHNGTAWTWPFPSFAEALLATYGTDAIRTARSILLSGEPVLEDGCILQIPEIIDGDFPHALKGCGAQAWGVTELYRLLKNTNLI
jgi:predicted glycogen debranching enzyme